MTENNAAQAAEQDPLSDDYINHLIRQHGYDSPETVIARLWQWIGLNGGENSVTLLIYEAHKALSKLRAEGVQAGDERALTANQRKEFIRRTSYISEADRDTRAGFVDEIARAALASAPVADNTGEKPAGFANCPITGMKFWGNIEHPSLGTVATYGGPFDTYTIPALCDDGELRSEHFDQDAGQWVEGGRPIGWAYNDQQDMRPMQVSAPVVDERAMGHLTRKVELLGQVAHYADLCCAFLRDAGYAGKAEALASRIKAVIDFDGQNSAPVAGEYMSAMGEAAQAYLDSFPYAHKLPAQFRWMDLWDAMRNAAPQAAPVAGEAQPVGYIHPDTLAQLAFPMTPYREVPLYRVHRPHVEFDAKRPAGLVPIYTAPQASEAVRDAAQKSARAIAFDVWLARHCDSDDLTAYERDLARDAWNTALSAPQASSEPVDLTGIDADHLLAISASGSHTAMSNALLNVARALKTQADEDGGDCAKGGGYEDLLALMERAAREAGGSQWVAEGFESRTPGAAFYGGLIMNADGETVVAQCVNESNASHMMSSSPANVLWLIRQYRAALSPPQPTEQGERDAY